MNLLRRGRADRPLAARSILALAFGTLAIAWPAIALGEFVVLFGAYLFFDGLAAMWSAAIGEHRAERWGFFAEGAACVVLGAVAFFQPFIPIVLLYLVATWGIVTGVLEILVAAHMRASTRSEWLLSLAGISSIFLGMLLLTVPGAGSPAVVRVIGVYALAFSLLLFLTSRRLLEEASAPPEDQVHPRPRLVEVAREARERAARM